MHHALLGARAARPSLIAALLAIGALAAPAAVVDSLTIAEQAGVTTSRYPIQIGRPFLAGEIPGAPQALIDGVPVPTQSDVKTRWPDGSARHAIVSFLIPTLAANSRVTVTFRDQGTSAATPVTRAEMLAPGFDFEARMALSGGVIATTSARQVLLDWDGTSDADIGPVKLWTRGPIATTAILADHSGARAYDVGSDAHRSFRPIVHATFWPGIAKVRVRFIGEIADTIALQDQSYDLALKLGLAAPSTVYAKTGILHHAASRWTKEFWIGGAPPAIAIDHNLAWLALTRATPNYDTGKVIPPSAIDGEYATNWDAWTTKPRDLFDAGGWQKAMGSPGGRSEIGPYPKWTVAWLFTGDRRMREEAFVQADLAGAWPMHLREGNPAKTLDPAGAVPGIGRVLSVCSHPTISIASGYDYAYTAPADRIVPVGTMTNGDPDPYQGWTPDGAHQPDAFSPQYLCTGDFWYLEEMQFWAAFSAARPNGAAIAYDTGRGPTGKEGGIQDEVRGEGWVFRNRVQTASACPDGSPEKAYFTTLVLDAIAKWEGQRGITGTALQGTPVWNWANTVGRQRWGTLGLPPLHQWEGPNAGLVDDRFMDTAKAGAATSQWMENWLIYGLGRGKELGYPTDALLTWVGAHLIGQLTDPAIPPKYSSAYRIATVDRASGQWLTSWAAVRATFLPAYDIDAWFAGNVGNDEQGYPQTTIPAAAMLAGEPGGAAAWSWIAQTTLSNANIPNDPKWAIIPRTSSGGGTTTGGTTTGGTTGGTTTGGTTGGTTTGGTTGGTTTGGTTGGTTTGGTTGGTTTGGTTGGTTTGGTTTGGGTTGGSSSGGGRHGGGCGLGGGIAGAVAMVLALKRRRG